ncbi:MAG: pyruvate, phosphate dikinase [Calditrichaeota bacterium]|nr:pyruvate, phosphate dikinase [Calditrichota bacterium]MCB9391095.1 pyruvate, phosphate dikinase [Calditrichota bacterium]
MEKHPLSKYVYTFGNGKAEGRADMKDLLGGKGANLAEMNHLGLPVPPGYTISTEVCTYYYANNRSYPTELTAQIADGIKYIEGLTGAKFGDAQNPLLVSVRSGARASMPGMMDTILNLGLNDKTVEGLIARSGDARFAYDSYRRFVAMYGDVVLDLKPQTKEEHDPFEDLLDAKKKKAGVKYDSDLNADQLKELVAEFKKIIKERKGVAFPEDPQEQLWGAVGAVFNSWMNERAIVYRRLNRIPESWGTAVNVQAMVFGNLGNDCATGVAFTRDPATGEKVFYGEFLVNAQGEDVVAGTRTPQQVAVKASKTWSENHGISEADRSKSFPSLEETMPDAYKQLLTISDTLEKHYKDMNDIEFTIQDKKLWMLQCRVGKRTGMAAVRIAVEMVDEGLLSSDDAVLRVDPNALNQLLRPVFDAEKLKSVSPIARGLNAGPGAAAGRVVFHASDAEAWAAKGEKVILARVETSPEDIRGMDAAQGILTQRGGMTSHAALVARQMGKVCVAGCEQIHIDYTKGHFTAGSKTVKEGDWISLNGTTGEIYEGAIPTKPSEVIQVLLDKTLDPKDAPTYQLYAKLMGWADKVRRMRVRTNADQPDQCKNALAFGAEGIGLTRTEHMFFEGDRIDAVREMILAADLEGRKKALAKLEPYQREDFVGIFKVMNGLPVTIRLLDPPLHEFLPHGDAAVNDLAKKMGVNSKDIEAKIELLHEMNPMLGHRGCRLGILYPEITEMQARAIFTAACEVKKQGTEVHPEVMVPLVMTPGELKAQADVIHRAAKGAFKTSGVTVEYLVGTMIELPRAALVADQIAQIADFFSFGTNDLTQTCMGLSRDDSGRFLPYYVQSQLLQADPFEALDQTGVGQLVEMGTSRGRQTKPKLKVGICGEHGGEPSSVIFFDGAGLDYVSCSPFRVPIARLAAAQATLQHKKG